MNSVDILRNAAKLLRYRAQSAVMAPWRASEEIDGVHAGHRTVVRAAGGERVVTVGQTRRHAQNGEANVTYIASMHPGIGHALADWLDEEAYRVCSIPDGGDSRAYEPALRIAELVIGGPA